MDQYGALDDAKLIRHSLDRDKDAFGELVRRYQDRIFATVFRILGNAEDAREMAQEAFFRAFSKLETFREGARF
jgi:RNA polymerase sigma-70 factor, ECF subfamily